MLKALKNWQSHRKQNLLSYRLLIYILMCSTLLAVLSTAVQLYWDYKNDISNIEKGIQSIEAGYLDSLASSLWKLDQDQIGIQLDGIMKLPDIGFTSITEIVANKEESVFYRGNKASEFPIFRQFELFYNQTLVGRLEVGATLDNVYDRLLKKFLVILGSQAIKTFLVSICILVIVHLLVVRHLNSLSRYTQHLDLDNLDNELQLEKAPKPQDQSDAIDQLANTIREMRNNIRTQLNGKKQAQEQLQQLNEELEQRVQYRTATLKHTNDRLSSALQELTATKDKLVESEKMAALGELVAGVAHEINTPVGNSLTSSSLINDLAEDFKNNLKQGTLTQVSADEFSRDICEASQLISINLQRASTLITSFKQIAVDQGNEQTRPFNLSENLQQAISLLKPEIDKSNCKIDINCDTGLRMVSYPDSLIQVYNNLISNSIIHGFESKGDGLINIDIERNGGNILIHYRDNGRGIPEQIKHRIFNPFVTGKRGAGGGSGLGTHLVYNLITQLLNGSIECVSTEGQGAGFEIVIPVQHQSQPDDEDDDCWE
ncbi:MAG: ATP-binding protein [Motiliproteus sp.]